MRVINITVHGVGPAKRQLDPAEGDTWVSPAQLELALDSVVGRDDVRITFDDGNSSDVEIALPLLVDRGLTAEFFVLAGQLGHPGRITIDHLYSLVEAGMRIGSHGWDHRDWRHLSDSAAQQEIQLANQRLTELIGTPVTRVAIPFGSYDRHVLQRLRNADVTRVYTSDGGSAKAGAWLQARTSLRHDMDDLWMRQVLADDPPVLLKSRRKVARTVKRIRG